MKVIDFGREECKKIAGYPDPFVNNELSVETSQLAAEHLEKCPACTAELDARMRLKGVVKRAVQTLVYRFIKTYPGHAARVVQYKMSLKGGCVSNTR